MHVPRSSKKLESGSTDLMLCMRIFAHCATAFIALTRVLALLNFNVQQSGGGRQLPYFKIYLDESKQFTIVWLYLSSEFGLQFLLMKFG